MASIIASISRLLTPEIIGKLASASGLDRTLTQSAVSAAVPAILSALSALVARPNGAQQLANSVAQQPTDILASITKSLTGSGPAADKGTSLLSSLLGADSLGGLTSTVSRFLGIGEGPMRTLMGLLAPLVMGVLGREQRAAGLDANGLARMLIGQKDEITSAMPEGLSRLLERTSRSSEATAAPTLSERRTSDAPGTSYTPAMQRPSSEKRSWASWPYWVVPLLVLAVLLWYLLGRDRGPLDNAATSTASEHVREVQTNSAYLSSVPDNWVSIGSAPNEYVNKEIYNRAGDQVGTIKDVLVGPDGKMAAAIINVGRYLGMGEKDVAVPFSALQQQRQDSGQRIVIDATKDGLQAAPTFVRRQPSKQ